MTIGRTLTCLAVLNAAAALVLLPHDPLRLFSSWLRVLLISGPDRAFEIGSQSFLALAGRLLRHDGYGLNIASLPNPAVALVAIGAELAIFSSLFVPKSVVRASPTREVWDAALLMTFMVLFSPTCWIATYSAMFFAVFLAVALVLDRPRVTLRSAPLALSTAAIVILSALMSAKVWRLLGIRSFRSESYVYLVLMILPCFGLAVAWCVWHQRRVAARYLQ